MLKYFLLSPKFILAQKFVFAQQMVQVGGGTIFCLGIIFFIFNLKKIDFQIEKKSIFLNIVL